MAARQQSEKEKDRKIEIQKALIGLMGIVIGAVLTALLPPLVQKWMASPEAAAPARSITIEQLPFTIYTYEGDDDPSECCSGRSYLQLINDKDLQSAYGLNYVLPENTSDWGYAGFAFVFDGSQNLSTYDALEFTIQFGSQVSQAEVNLQDITLKKFPYPVLGTENEETKVVVPLSNFTGVDLHAVRSIGFQVNSSFTTGNHTLILKQIALTKR